MENNALKEQRMYERFLVKEGVFAVSRSHTDKVGQIIDIGMDGLAFRYIADVDEMEGSFELDILVTNNGLLMKGVKVKLVSDLYEYENETPFSVIPTRRCGVQFSELTKSQISQLEYFINNHTKGLL